MAVYNTDENLTFVLLSSVRNCLCLICWSCYWSWCRESWSWSRPRSWSCYSWSWLQHWTRHLDLFLFVLTVHK